ncbi:MAG: NFACT RNA binding domain-containing protein [Candidatus Anstonellaceae archaeon]
MDSKKEIELSSKKNIWKNLEEIYQKLKELELKKEKIEQEIEKTKKEMDRLYQETPVAQEQKKEIKKRKLWYENYLWFYTTNNFLVIAGKNAKQNDELYAKHLKEEDLFFHAEIIGAPATILKNGLKAKEKDILETAQWAASFSSAWKKKIASIDVYYVKKEQITKHSAGQYVGKGAFLILGKRNWLKDIELALKIIKENEQFYVLPKNHSKNKNNLVFLYPGDIEKEKAIDIIYQRTKIKKEEISSRLPSGGYEIK